MKTNILFSLIFFLASINLFSQDVKPMKKAKKMNSNMVMLDNSVKDRDTEGPLFVTLCTGAAGGSSSISTSAEDDCATCESKGGACGKTFAIVRNLNSNQNYRNKSVDISKSAINEITAQFKKSDEINSFTVCVDRKGKEKVVPGSCNSCYSSNNKCYTLYDSDKMINKKSITYSPKWNDDLIPKPSPYNPNNSIKLNDSELMKKRKLVKNKSRINGTSILIHKKENNSAKLRKRTSGVNKNIKTTDLVFVIDSKKRSDRIKPGTQLIAFNTEGKPFAKIAADENNHFRLKLESKSDALKMISSIWIIPPYDSGDGVLYSLGGGGGCGFHYTTLPRHIVSPLTLIENCDDAAFSIVIDHSLNVTQSRK